MKNKKRRLKRLIKIILTFITLSIYIDVKPQFNIYINNDVDNFNFINRETLKNNNVIDININDTFKFTK